MMGLGRAEHLHHPCQQTFRTHTHVNRSGGQPQRVDADHRSHSRNQAPQSPASSLGHITVTEDVPRRNSMRISGMAATATGLVEAGSGSVLKVTGTNACG